MSKNKFTSSNVDDCFIKNFNVLDHGNLLPIDLKEIPFSVKRIFSVKGDKSIVRGEHAHSECKQFLICSQGKLMVHLDDGSKKKKHLLLKGSGIYLPIGIWGIQEYLMNKSTLLVMCSHEYNESEYIRDHKLFIRMKKI
jgi:UDP-2-acetamido-3-amino-2,3-dideoxy-glucuronate N-acetyltransferase